MKKNLKRIIILIIVILIVFVLYNLTNKFLEHKFNYEMEGTSNEVHRLNNKNIFFSIEETLNSIISTVCEGDSLAIYSILDDEYIVQNNVNEENSLSKISPYTDFDRCIVKEVWEARQTDSINSYYIHCKIRTEKEDTLDEISDEKDEYFLMRIDISNMTYLIAPKGNTFSEENKNSITKMDDYKIISNGYNNFNIIYPDEVDIVHNYYQEIVKLMLYKPEELYNYLEKEYKNKEFKSIDKFKEYVNRIKEGIEEAYILEYDVEFPKEKGESENIAVQYTIKDSKGYTYIIKEKEILNFEIIL